MHLNDIPIDKSMQMKYDNIMNFKDIKYNYLIPINFKPIKPNILLQNYASINFSPKYMNIAKINIIPQLNIFHQITISEPNHSAILANLLSPQGTHGLNCLFLKVFFDVFVNKMKINDKECWFVTAEKERFDIRIRNQDNSKIIIIENKSNNAQDQPNQLYRYWFNGIYLPQYYRSLCGLECFAKIIYLSPSNYKMPEEQSLTRPDNIKEDHPNRVPEGLLDIAFYNVQIIKWLDLCIEMVENNTNVYYYLTQYRNFWR
jgi:hypothetical protein